MSVFQLPGRSTIALSVVAIFFCGFLRSAHAETLTTIHIGVPTNSATWFPLYVAWKKGMFREQGLDLLPVTMQVRTAPRVGYKARNHFAGSVAWPRGGLSQPGGTVHRELLLILEKYKIDTNSVKLASLGSTPNGVVALKGGNVDGAILLMPHDLYLEKDGFRGLVYLKDVLDFPLAGIVAHNDQLRERPDDVKNILRGALRGINYTKTRGEDVLPLLKEFLALESLEMARKAYGRLRDIWSNNGVPSEKGLKAAATLAEVSSTFPLEKLANWSFLNEAASSLKSR
jgi:ABC-type nitrate/sulfonate/bicarbonate transport system substrate-binding protein